MIELSVIGSSLRTRWRTTRDVRQAINDINHRLRYAIGEYWMPPDSVPAPWTELPAWESDTGRLSRGISGPLLPRRDRR
jgi:hypothetical protein